MNLSFRWKLLLAFGVTTVVAVAVVAFVATRLVGASFLRGDRERIEGVLGQAQASIQRRGELAGRRVTAASESEAATRMAIALNQSPQGTPAPGVFLTEATTLARAHELDLLQLIAHDGTILSSAQWQARAGYREPGLARLVSRKTPFVRLEELPSGQVLAVEVVRDLSLGARKLYLIGGYPLDESFVSELSQAGLEHVVLFRLAGQGQLVPMSGASRREAVGEQQSRPGSGVGEALRLVAERVVLSGAEYRGELGRAEGVAAPSSVAGTPIRDVAGTTLGALVVTVSGAERVQVIRSLYWAAVVAGALGLLAAMVLTACLQGGGRRQSGVPHPAARR